LQAPAQTGSLGFAQLVTVPLHWHVPSLHAAQPQSHDEPRTHVEQWSDDGSHVRPPLHAVGPLQQYWPSPPQVSVQKP
jgi:hypothetical protein